MNTLHQENAPSPARVAVVLSHPIQYYAPWFRHLASTALPALKVFYLSDHGITVNRDANFGTDFAWDTDLLSGYRSEFVPNHARHPDVTTFTGLHNPDLPAALRRFAPEAILLFGYAYRTHLQLILHSPAPLIFRGDSHLLGQPRTRWLKQWLLRLLYRRFSAVTYVGNANRNYFRTFGVPDRKLFFAPHAVDQNHFSITEQNLLQARKLRETLGLSDRLVVLFAGKLVPAKQPRELLQAFIRLAPANAALVFTGDGAEKPALVNLAAQHPGHMVRFLPFANQRAMPAHYLMADLFALPSRGHYETWGLAVNEAMHLGVPCLVSDRVGCQSDLVTEGETGWVFPVGEPEGLHDGLKRAFDQLDSNRSGMKPAIAKRISAYTYAQSTAGLLQALHSLPR